MGMNRFGKLERNDKSVAINGKSDEMASSMLKQHLAIFFSEIFSESLFVATGPVILHNVFFFRFCERFPFERIFLLSQLVGTNSFRVIYSNFPNPEPILAYPPFISRSFPSFIVYCLMLPDCIV